MMQQADVKLWNADEILLFLRQHSAELKALGVVKIGLFGSYVRSEQHAGSDIDLLVLLDHWTWRRWCAVWQFLEDQLQQRIDLVPEDDLRAELRPYVLPEVRYVALV